MKGSRSDAHDRAMGLGRNRLFSPDRKGNPRDFYDLPLSLSSSAQDKREGESFVPRPPGRPLSTASSGAASDQNKPTTDCRNLPSRVSIRVLGPSCPSPLPSPALPAMHRIP